MIESFYFIGFIGIFMLFSLFLVIFNYLDRYPDNRYQGTLEENEHLLLNNETNIEKIVNSDIDIVNKRVNKESTGNIDMNYMSKLV